MSGLFGLGRKKAENEVEQDVGRSGTGNTGTGVGTGTGTGTNVGSGKTALADSHEPVANDLLDTNAPRT